jgi:hypothetical protein
LYTVHATFAGAPAVQALAAKARDRLVGVPGLDLIPGEWLHLTMQGIGFADEVSDADLSAVITAAKARLAVVPPVTVAIGPPVVAGEGVTCWASPPRALDQVRDAVRGGTANAWGPGRVQESADWSAHVSVAYASADGPGELSQEAAGISLMMPSRATRAAIHRTRSAVFMLGGMSMTRWPTVAQVERTTRSAAVWRSSTLAR